MGFISEQYFGKMSDTTLSGLLSECGETFIVYINPGYQEGLNRGKRSVGGEFEGCRVGGDLVAWSPKHAKATHLV